MNDYNNTLWATYQSLTGIVTRVEFNFVYDSITQKPQKIKSASVEMFTGSNDTYVNLKYVPINEIYFSWKHDEEW